jgi:hypothetical protein
MLTKPPVNLPSSRPSRTSPAHCQVWATLPTAPGVEMLNSREHQFGDEHGDRLAVGHGT